MSRKARIQVAVGVARNGTLDAYGILWQRKLPHESADGVSSLPKLVIQTRVQLVLNRSEKLKLGVIERSELLGETRVEGVHRQSGGPKPIQAGSFWLSHFRNLLFIPEPPPMRRLCQCYADT
jgi:hypothetical protein